VKLYFEIRAAWLDLDFREKIVRAGHFEIAFENFWREELRHFVDFFFAFVDVDVHFELEIGVGSTDGDDESFDDNSFADVSTVRHELEVVGSKNSVGFKTVSTVRMYLSV